MKKLVVPFLAIMVLLPLPAFAQKQFKVADRVTLGGEGGWDYLSYDHDGHRAVHHHAAATLWWWMHHAEGDR